MKAMESRVTATGDIVVRHELQPARQWYYVNEHLGGVEFRRSGSVRASLPVVLTRDGTIVDIAVFAEGFNQLRWIYLAAGEYEAEIEFPGDHKRVMISVRDGAVLYVRV